MGLAVLWMVMKRGFMERAARRARERGDMKSRSMRTSPAIWDMVRGTGGALLILKLMAGGREVSEHAANRAGSARNAAFAINFLTFMILP